MFAGVIPRSPAALLMSAAEPELGLSESSSNSFSGMPLQYFDPSRDDEEADEATKESSGLLDIAASQLPPHCWPLRVR